MGRSRILIVHSDPSSLAVLSSMLASLGHEIAEAANAGEATGRLEQGGIDVVVDVTDPRDPAAMGLLADARRGHWRVPVILLLHEPGRREGRRGVADGPAVWVLPTRCRRPRSGRR